MKATIFEIKRFAVHDGDGIRTTVFFKGCPLKCVWCHNPEGIDFKPQLAYYEEKCINCGECVRVCKNTAHTIKDGMHIFLRKECRSCSTCEKVCVGEALKLYGREITVEEMLPMLLEDKEFFDNSNGGVTLSGGECLMQADFCRELLKHLKGKSVNTAVDTCGFVPGEAIEKVIPYTDAFLYDLKAFDEAVHIRCAGFSNRVILDNLRYIDEQNKQIEIRIPYVPGLNDGEIGKIGRFLSDFKNISRVRVLPYHNYAGGKYMALDINNTLPDKLPSDDDIKAAEECIRDFGLTV